VSSPGTCTFMKPRETPSSLSSSTSIAPGCQVRPMILSPCWWGPRHAKGSPCSARISACTWTASIRSSPALPLSIVILHEGFAQLYQPSQGHIQPLRAVAGFVRNLVGGLLDTEQRQRCLFSIVLLPDMVQTGCGLPVGFEKRLHRLFPVSFTDDRPGLLSRLRLLGAMEAAQGCGCRIIEGAQQSADVLVRTVALTPLLQWPRWLALEVDEADITGQHQHLSQMQVPMNAVTDGTFDTLCRTLHAFTQQLTMLQQPADLLPRQVPGTLVSLTSRYFSVLFGTERNLAYTGQVHPATRNRRGKAGRICLIPLGHQFGSRAHHRNIRWLRITPFHR